MSDAAPSADAPVVGLFVTCLVDLFRPSVAFAAVKLLEAAGCKVAVPAAQTCCGQPGYNSGAKAQARAIARQTIRAFAGFDHVVAPSGSCAGMIKRHYPEIFADDPALLGEARALAARTHELTAFLADIRGVKSVPGDYRGILAYHDSCSSLRECGVKAQPRALLKSIPGVAVRDLPGAEACCGFGGTFCVKYPEISNHMAADKAREIVQSGADTLVAGDMGCLMNLAGKLSRDGHGSIRAYHVAEVLAGVAAAPIGAPARSSGDGAP
jgi:L-lactate dehydrogenase complex protein LldE